MSMIPHKEKVYDDGRTKQAFKDETDINKLLARAQKAGTLSHLQKHGAFYGDFANFDFEEAQFALARARSIFEELPSELRREFHHNPGEFFKFVNDPANADDLPRVLPGLAAPGRQVVLGKPGSVKPPPAVEPPAEPVASSEAPQEPISPDPGPTPAPGPVGGPGGPPEGSQPA